MDVDDLDRVDRDLVALQPDLKIPWETKRETYRHVFARLRERYEFATLADAVESAKL